MAKSYKLSKRSKKNIEGIDDRLIILSERSLKKSPHDYGHPNDGGFRTARDQYALYIKRNPKVTWVDGYNLKSYHQTGKAFDIFCLNGRNACWTECWQKYEEIALVIKAEFELMKEEGIFKENEVLIWGGDWRRPDRPHFEIREI
jgi:peptidoglycan L-alanyl-D-glutamate endopeptidase CwlK